MAVTLQKTIISLFEAKKYKTLRDVLCVTNGADIADLFSDLSNEAIPILFRLLPKDIASDTFAMMESDDQELLIKSFSDSELKELFEELYVDDVVDIIEEMPANVVKRIIANTDPQTRKDINEILKYPEDSAGSLMTVEYITLRPDMSVSEAIKRIKRTVAETRTIYNCYVVDINRVLMGALPIKTLLVSDADDIVENIMEQTVISVVTLTDKEEVYKLMSKYDTAILPVVDEENRLVGIVTFDDAIDVMQEETTEDIERMAAIAPSEDGYFKTTDISHAKNRIVWLFVLMIGAALTGVLLVSYEEAIASVPMLVSFIPMIMATGGNCGAQSSTTVIRSMSIDEIKSGDFFKVIWTELRVSLVVSISLGIINAIRIIIMYHDSNLAMVVSVAMVLTMIFAQLIGCLLPMLAKKIKLDPAVMASPVITTLVDATSIIIYFNIASNVFKI